MGPALVDLKNVRVIRGDNVALDDFSLCVEAGEHVAILGPNGCGKSTLIKTITRECYPVLREGSSMTILGRERWNIFEKDRQPIPVLADIVNTAGAPGWKSRSGWSTQSSQRRGLWIGFFFLWWSTPHESCGQASHLGEPSDNSSDASKAP